MRDYELTYIIKPDLEATALATLVERISGFVAAEGGKVAKTNQWGVRHLAYPIRRYREGHYVFSLIQLESTALARVEARLRQQEDMLRYLLVRADDLGDDATADTDVMGGAADAPATPMAEAPAETPAASMSAAVPAPEPAA